eukprot:3636431-Amphidinium_carterae.1
MESSHMLGGLEVRPCRQCRAVPGVPRPHTVCAGPSQELAHRLGVSGCEQLLRHSNVEGFAESCSRPVGNALAKTLLP